jgi:hypothetical protein
MVVKRFRVALSFPGEYRTFVARVAKSLARQLGNERVFYDHYYEAELARPDLDTYLQQLYHDEAELIVVFLCAEYERKEWCGLEWRAIRDLLKRKQASAIMPMRFDDTHVPGLFSIDGYVNLSNRKPGAVARLILQRLTILEADTHPSVGATLPAGPTTAGRATERPALPLDAGDIIPSHQSTLDTQEVGRNNGFAALDQALASTPEHHEAWRHMDAQFEAVHRRLEERGPDHYVVEAHSERAQRELCLLLKQRSLTPDRVRQTLMTLAQRVTDGELRYVEHAIRAQVQYWAARLHALQPATLPVARDYLTQLQHTDPGADTRIIEALILEAEENVDGALQMLRDLDTPDGRATFFTTLFRTRGTEVALSWFDDQLGRDNPGFLTGIGWSNVAICLANMGRWEEAAERLTAAQEHVEEWPDLAFVEGVINAAMLLPIEWRQYALEMHLFHEGLRPIEGLDAARHRARAKVCFEKAKDLLAAIDQPERIQGAQHWLLWLRLTDPIPTVVHEARQEVQEGMNEGQKAVDLILFARAFGIAFDDTALRRYLLQRKMTGGLSGRELVAEFLLAELSMNPRDRAEFLEREEERLSQVISKASLVGKRIEALIQDGQGIRARHLLEVRRDVFVDHDYERLRTWSTITFWIA